jgi:cysteine desulfurase
MKIYLDNAATTAMDPEVFEAMKPFMLDFYGNPSSVHANGREVRAAIESARKKIAGLINASPLEIFFTSGGTEADNAIICSAVRTFGITHIITSPIEHHAVLHTCEYLAQQKLANVSMVALDEKGNVDLSHLRHLLETHPRSLVSLMQANNEIGNITDLHAIGKLCKEFNALLHSDTVQTIGHYPHDMATLPVHFMSAAAHKFHGPKGVGFMYVRKDSKINSYIQGGSQELNMRGGTENVYGIIGLAKAMEIAYEHMDEHQKYIQGLKNRMTEGLKNAIPGISFNGESSNASKSLYTVLNVCLPESDQNDFLLFTLDINGICASGGSACSSGASKGSHVLDALKVPTGRGSVRFSFSKYNTPEEIDFVVEQLAALYQEKTVG